MALDMEEKVLQVNISYSMHAMSLRLQHAMDAQLEDVL